jgi:hypothetical protein
VTPGILFAIAVQLSKGQEDEARKTAGDIARQIEDQFKSLKK